MFVIPSIYVRNNKTVRLGEGGAPFNEDPVEMARDLEALGAELLYIVDLDVPPSGNIPHLSIIEKIAAETSLKLQLTGNIKSADIIERYFNAGIERIVLGAIAYQKPDFLKSVCQKFPRKIAVHIDVRGGKVVITGWTVASNKTALDYSEQFRNAGVGSILYSDVASEGTITPKDIKRIEDFSKKSPLPLIHATDPGSVKELELILGFKSVRVLGTIIGKSMYAGIVDISSTITHVKERIPEGMEEETLIP